MIRDMWTFIKEDARVFKLAQPHSGLLGFLYHPDFRVVLAFRLSQLCYSYRYLRPFAYVLTVLNDLFNGVWIGPRVKAGPGLFMGHPRGLVVNPTTVIGSYCYILQRVTIGGEGVTVGDYVEINANATIVANDRVPGRGLHIGSNVIVGAGAVVIRDVPDCVVVAGVPATVVKHICPAQNWVEWRRLRVTRPG